MRLVLMERKVIDLLAKGPCSFLKIQMETQFSKALICEILKNLEKENYIYLENQNYCLNSSLQETFKTPSLLSQEIGELAESMANSFLQMNQGQMKLRFIEMDKSDERALKQIFDDLNRLLEQIHHKKIWRKKSDVVKEQVILFAAQEIQELLVLDQMSRPKIA